VPDSWIEETVPCKDPDCPGRGEPETDGDVRYYTCLACGFEFGYSKMPQPADSGVCAIGVPEQVRRAFPGPREPVMLQIGRRPQ
jgi:hypothetical protein